MNRKKKYGAICARHHSFSQNLAASIDSLHNKCLETSMPLLDFDLCLRYYYDGMASVSLTESPIALSHTTCIGCDRKNEENASTTLG